MRMLDERLSAGARIAPRRTALIDGERRISWSDLDGCSAERARDLVRRGLRRGDRVVVRGPNSIETVVALLSVLRAGGTVVPIAADVRPARLQEVLADSGAGLFIGAPTSPVESGRDWSPIPLDGTFAADTEVSLARVAEGASTAPTARGRGAIDADLAALLYTSGSTGEPKGVMLTHANLENTSGVVAGYLALGPDDTVCIPVSIAHSYGLLQLLASLRSGSTVVLERSAAYPFEALRRMERTRTTVLISVPTLIARLIDLVPSLRQNHPLRLESIRAVTNAGAALPATHARRVLEVLRGAELHLMYGQTECSRATTLDPGLAERYPDSVGRAIANCEVFLVDDDGRRIDRDGEGELVVRGANVSPGYWRRPDDTEATFVAGASPGERLLRTGDRFRVDGEGLLRFLGRMDEVFKCRGMKVAPAAVESALCAIPGVVEAFVEGVPHPEDGTAVRAVVVTSPGAELDAARIRAASREHLEPALVPRFVEIEGDLPRVASGKVRRRAIGPPSAGRRSTVAVQTSP